MSRARHGSFAIVIDECAMFLQRWIALLSPEPLMNSPLVVIVLRLLHITAGVFWVGGVVFLAFFLLPTMKIVGPSGTPVMTHLMQKVKVPLRFLAAGYITVITGLLLYWHDGSVSAG